MTTFPDIEKIRFEGPDTSNPLAFRRYDPDRMIGDASMREHLRFASCYWHTMRNELADPFGAGTARMPWDDRSTSISNALARVEVFFEFLDKIDIDF
ncbi:MAG: xylose isomerase, partial [Phycisphaera sp.]|nr:xylose isomerase [Phycisphaera sp.]